MRRLQASCIVAALTALEGCCGSGVGRLEPRSAAEYAEHAADLRADAPPGFTIVVVPPFVVAGDGPPSAVRADAQDLVGWAVKLLKADYFARDPVEVVDIWLFDGEESYLRNTDVMFGEYPLSPYGYYSPCEDALIMNAATGGGTLVHEMVHPFMAANFPGCPSWFNEGLASLYEQTEEKDGHIHGRTNWRLAGLQQAIRARRVPSVEALTSTSRSEFYDRDTRGTNYAMARYLCFYLQERGLLIRFFHRFNENRENDPTGYATLKEILGEADLEAWQARWETFVMGLSFP